VAARPDNPTATCVSAHVAVKQPVSPAELFDAACAAAGIRRVPARRRRPLRGGPDSLETYSARGLFEVAVTCPASGALPEVPDFGRGTFACIDFTADGMPAARLLQPVNLLGGWLLEFMLPWELRHDGSPWVKGTFPVLALPR
jgi:hypothetical protein